MQKMTVVMIVVVQRLLIELVATRPSKMLEALVARMDAREEPAGGREGGHEEGSCARLEGGR